MAQHSSASKLSKVPPAPRVYKSVDIQERKQSPTGPPEQPATTPPKKTTLLSRLFPFKPSPQAPIHVQSPNPARGLDAARRAVQHGVLDPRYTPAARRILIAVVAAPIAIVTSYELFARRFMGKQQKIPGQKPADKSDGTQQSEVAV